MQAHRITVQAAKPTASPQPREPVPAASLYISRRAIAAYRSFRNAHRESGSTLTGQGIAFGRLLELWTLAKTWELRREAALAERLICRTSRINSSTYARPAAIKAIAP